MSIKQDINKGQNVTKELSKKEQLKMWMHKIELLEYYDIFIKNGVEDLEVVKLLNMDTLNHMNINKIGHKIKLLAEIQKLKQSSSNNDNQNNNQPNIKSYAQEGNIIDTLQ